MGFFVNPAPNTAPICRGHRAALSLARLTTCVAAAVFGALPAVASLPVAPVGLGGGVTEAVAVEGDRAYLAAGYRVVILDVANPAEPVELAWTEALRGPVHDVAVSDGYVYVAAGDFGLRPGYLQVIDARDPTAPVVVGEYATEHSIRDLKVSGSYAYVVCTKCDVHVVDISNPASPVRVAICEVIDPVEVVPNGDFVYVRSSLERVFVFDLSDLAEPRQVAEYRLQFANRFYGMAHSGRYLYVLHEHGFQWLEYVDVSNPAQPVHAGLEILLDFPRRIEVVGTTAYAVTDDGIDIYDVSAPSPKIWAIHIGKVLTERNRNESAIAVSGDRAFVPHTWGGLWIIDLEQDSRRSVQDRALRNGALFSRRASDRLGPCLPTGDDARQRQGHRNEREMAANAWNTGIE